MAFKFVILSVLLAVANAGYLSPIQSHYAAAPAVVAKVADPAVDAVATTHQNVVRSFGGTVSQYSKSIHTPYSSVHKEDTRVNNNVYTPAIAKTVSYAAPVVEKTVAIDAAPTAAAIYSTHAAPVIAKTVYAQPETAHVYASPAPHTVYNHEQPAPTAAVYTHHHHQGHEQPAPTAVVYTHHSHGHEQPAPTTAVYTHHHHGHEQPAPTAAVYTHHSHGHEQPAPTAASVFTHHHEIPSTAATAYNHGPAATTYSHKSHGVSAYGSSQTVHYSPAEMVSHMSFDGFGTHWGF